MLAAWGLALLGSGLLCGEMTFSRKPYIVISGTIARAVVIFWRSSFGDPEQSF
jgi:hypothetical protein